MESDGLVSIDRWIQYRENSDPDSEIAMPPHHIQQAMTQLLDGFEQEQKSGEEPRLEDYLARIEENWRPHLLRELLSRSRVSKWNWESGEEETLFVAAGRGGGRGPNLMGDLVGDWREEILTTAPDGQSLRLYTTTMATEYRIYSLMHDPQYRLSMAWQNVVYNKPPYPGFFLGDRMSTLPRPDIHLVGKGEGFAAAQ